MNHPLSVYTVIYLAILFITVSIWGSGLASTGGDGRILLAAQGTFGLKLAIDDYIHFQRARKERLHIDLSLSLLIYLLLAVSLAGTATKREHLATLMFGAVFVIGLVWLASSGFSGEGDGKRRRRWARINLAAAILLAWACWEGPNLFNSYTAARWPLTLLLSLIVIDFFWIGSLKRLAELKDEDPMVAKDPIAIAKVVDGVKTAPDVPDSG